MSYKKTCKTTQSPLVPALRNGSLVRRLAILLVVAGLACAQAVAQELSAPGQLFEGLQEQALPQLQIEADWELRRESGADELFLVSTLGIAAGYHVNRDLLEIRQTGLAPTSKIQSQAGQQTEQRTQGAVLHLASLDDAPEYWPPISGQVQGIRYYSGTVQLRQKLRLKSGMLLPGTLQALAGQYLQLELSYQLCDDDGVCFLPTTQSYEIELPDYGSEAAAAPFWQALQRGGTAQHGNSLWGDGGASLWHWLGILLLSLLAGILLNLMPCIFPIFSLKLQKLLGFLVETRADSVSRPWRQAWGSLLYTLLGIELSFVALAALLFSLWGGTRGVLWGFQLQQPALVYAVLLLLFGMSLSLLGVFQFQTPRFLLVLLQKTQRTGSRGIAGSKAVQDIAHGALIVLLGTPCSAPLLGPLLGLLLLQSQLGLSLAGLLLIGLGLWLPYAVLFWLGRPKPISRSPAGAEAEKQGKREKRLEAAILGLQRNMPFIEQLLGFVLLATALYFYSVLLSLLDGNALSAASWVLASLLLLAISAWLWRRWQEAQARGVRHKGLALTYFCSLAGSLAMALWLGASFGSNTAKTAEHTTEFQKNEIRNITEVFQLQPEEWPRFWAYRASAAEQNILRELRSQGYGIFIEYTAAWCITCKLNQLRLLHTEAFGQLLRQRRTLYLKADLTKPQAALSKELNQWGRASLPFYLLFPPGGDQQAEILPVFPSYQDFAGALGEQE